MLNYSFQWPWAYPTFCIRSSEAPDFGPISAGAGVLLLCLQNVVEKALTHPKRKPQESIIFMSTELPAINVGLMGTVIPSLPQNGFPAEGRSG